MTGGNSAIYGSDAVAGVVNFIMKKDFEGVQFDAQYGFYQHNNDYDGVGNLRALAAAAFARHPRAAVALVAIDARMHEAYCGVYRNDDAVAELRAPALVLGPETASGQGLSGSWRSAAPLSIDWRMDSAAPRGHGGSVVSPGPYSFEQLGGDVWR